LTGVDGADGANGPQGLTGPTGADGPTGPQGIQGENGIQGPNGPAGEVTLAQLSTKQDVLTSGNNITIVDNVISSSGGGDVKQADLDTKQDVLTAGTGIDIKNNVISSSGGGDVTQADLETKQDVLTAGTGIEITNNVISSTGGGSSPFIGFRAAGNETFAQTIAFGQNPSGLMIIYADQANSTFDSQGTYDNATGFYTIRTGYSGWWEVSLKICMLTYAETASMISIK
jgi:hypothetical protein